MGRSRRRGEMKYEKPPLTLEQLVDRLAERGLNIPDREKAGHYLKHLGYFRLSPYSIPFQHDRTSHTFRAGATFDDVLKHYIFDRKLRLLVLDAVERIEVAIRSAVTDYMCIQYGDSHWYTDPMHFKDQDEHTKLLQQVESLCMTQLRRKPERTVKDLVVPSALEHYLTRYGSPQLPPSWLMVETISIGTLSSVLRNLARSSDQTAIAETIGLNRRLLISWSRTYVRVRNVCAHHGRLWNVGLGVYPAIPKSKQIPWITDSSALEGHSRRQLYPVLVSIQSILNTISPNSSWANRLSELLFDYPDMPLKGMGIPSGWREDPFWVQALSRK